MSPVKERKMHPWYNFSAVLSWNAFITMVCGGRGLGKTYGAKKIAIRKALRSFERREPIEQFIYLRRFKPEIVDSAPAFFADIAHEFPDYDFRVAGRTAQFAPVETRDDKKRDWHDMGFFVALSTAQSKKGVSYHKVTTIIFDEFIIEKTGSTYLPNEAKVFLGFYSTVDRNQDKTRVYMLSNAVSINNPYFIKWGIEPDKNKDEFKKFGRLNDGRYYMVAHFPDAKDFQESVYATAFGQFIKDTEFAEYAVGNDFADNNDAMLGLKDKDALYAFSIRTREGTFSVWNNHDTRMWYVASKRPRAEMVFTMHADLMEEGLIYTTRNDPLLGLLRRQWGKTMVKFDKPSTRNAMLPIFER